MVWYYIVWECTRLHSMVQYGMLWQHVVWYGMGWCDVVLYDVALYCVLVCSMVCYGMGQYCVVQGVSVHGTVLCSNVLSIRYGIVRNAMVWYGMM